MTEQELNAPHVCAALEKMNREGVAKRMRSDGFGEARGSTRLLARMLDRTPTEGVARDVAGEEPGMGLL
jgi:hypothetical protein